MKRYYWITIRTRKVKQALILVIASLFAVGLIYAEKNSMSVIALREPSAIYSVPTKEKKIALTFDISWGEIRTLPILEVLQEEGVKKATFFLSGPWSRDHVEIVRKIKEMGYEIGSHGYKHTNYSQLSDQEIREQILKAHAILKEITGETPTLIRTPNGDFDQRVLNIANQLGYTVIQWDTDSLDWKNPGVDAIVNRVLTKVHPGDIILMHASDSCKQTHLALPTMIKELRRKGYQFVTVSELISGFDSKVEELE
ncbi:putative polysaccharide deacetylase pdaB [[Clostridium] ultunense Esp]|uniref:polysaccharide deacetylase family sporulation protein PdaB n=1 Tax=Thermicanus aegyptius TaxID=94009 RepID=UPI0002B70BB2|nr:polysaccharide deacetylase family sporulation protein PdaB [Thermicanus aegyptius]CCQ95273.1 putative polysaccharide deacetylase pdaB [[Clostridium] ultunense Esp]